MAAAILVVTALAFQLPSTPLHNGVKRASPLRCSLAEERMESGKAGAIAALTGSLCSAPAALLASTAFTPQWEFATDTLVVQLLLFGVVYRYAVRSDDNEQLKQGAVGAFALVRTLSSVQVGDQCSAIPLNCGAPLGYLDWDMLLQLGASRDHELRLRLIEQPKSWFHLGGRHGSPTLSGAQPTAVPKPRSRVVWPVVPCELAHRGYVDARYQEGASRHRATATARRRGGSSRSTR